MTFNALFPAKAPIFIILFSLFLIKTGFSQTRLQADIPTTYINNASLSPDHARLLRDLSVLSADSLEGRKSGTMGSLKARQVIVNRLRSLGLLAFHPGFTQNFFFKPNPYNRRLFPRNAGKQQGRNVIGYIKGQEKSDRFLLVSAHYDHDGKRNGEIYNGANDNASGVAFLLLAAAHFTKTPPRHSIIFAAFDAEESGLKGAHAFVKSPPVDLKKIILNINLDMISPGKDSLLYVSGTDHFAALAPYVAKSDKSSFLKIVQGHNSKDRLEDWSYASDHAPFFRAGIPFLYFGVEDNAHYHRPSDTFENIIQPLFLESTNVILDVLIALDENLVD